MKVSCLSAAPDSPGALAYMVALTVGSNEAGPCTTTLRLMSSREVLVGVDKVTRCNIGNCDEPSNP